MDDRAQNLFGSPTSPVRHSVADALAAKLGDEVEHAAIATMVSEGALAAVVRVAARIAVVVRVRKRPFAHTLFRFRAPRAALHAEAMSFLRQQVARIDRDAWMYTAADDHAL